MLSKLASILTLSLLATNCHGESLARLPAPVAAPMAPAPVWNPTQIERIFDAMLEESQPTLTAFSIDPTVPLESPRQYEPKCSCWDCLHESHKNTGFIDLNNYWDTRHFAVTTINLLANLPGGFQYFQLINFESALDSDTHDWTGFFTEMNLRRPISVGESNLSQFDWTIQYADGSFPHGNLRLGARWRVHDSPSVVGRCVKDALQLKYSVNLHVIETDGTGWQLEHVIRRTFFDGKVYVAGFCDHNIDNHSRNSTWVTETQLGVQLRNSLYAVAEYRYNSFLPPSYRQGLGIGLEYVIRFR